MIVTIEVFPFVTQVASEPPKLSDLAAGVEDAVAVCVVVADGDGVAFVDAVCVGVAVLVADAFVASASAAFFLAASGVADAVAVCVGVADGFAVVVVADAFVASADALALAASADGVADVDADGDGVAVSAIALLASAGLAKRAKAQSIAKTKMAGRPKGRLFRGIDTIPSFRGKSSTGLSGRCRLAHWSAKSFS